MCVYIDTASSVYTSVASENPLRRFLRSTPKTHDWSMFYVRASPIGRSLRNWMFSGD